MDQISLIRNILSPSASLSVTIHSARITLADDYNRMGERE
jgi:hypothetical protein